MEDTTSVSGLWVRDRYVRRVRYRMTCSGTHGLVWLRKVRNDRISPIIAVAYRLGDDSFIKQYEGYHVPAAALEQLREHILAFYREATGEKALAHV